MPVLSGKDLCKILEKLGYLLDHQTGSHMILRNENPPHRRLSVPNHNAVAKGTLRSILRQAGLSTEEFEQLRKK